MIRADRTRALLATGLSLCLLRRGEVQRRTGCQPYRYEVSA